MLEVQAGRRSQLETRIAYFPPDQPQVFNAEKTPELHA